MGTFSIFVINKYQPNQN
ncbi:erythromycin resistance leader peptide [Staphylococcus aureus]|nr:erythromycin resistance leader peptide [Staphylococcus aureus]HCQ1957002.1 erythromycin resistance leader peptide [Staphylococcus aureus]HCQ2011061.1 erythromycin resistance leader peptide [Staphylococcus aureus]HCQ2011334.1 erythromycin resistance leader peptide [Staphylococcus aureus]HCV8075275.1 erythromycin resistance leader peptide [Staphylococcus aureus]